MQAAVQAPDVASQDWRLADIIQREQARLRRFIRLRVQDIEDAEDILQDVFSELVQATRLMTPIDHAGAWLFRVARNRIVNRFRTRRRQVSLDAPPESRDTFGSDARLSLEELLPSPDAGPDAAYARAVLLDELDAALDELPAAQRDVFVAHELEGRSFKEIAAATGVGVNTLLARKRYAVLRLRRRLQAIHDEWRSESGGSR